MSDRTLKHEVWLSKMRDHLKDEQYAARTVKTCLLVARRFLVSLETQRVEVDAARPARSRTLSTDRLKAVSSAARAWSWLPKLAVRAHLWNPHVAARRPGQVAAATHGCRCCLKQGKLC